MLGVTGLVASFTSSPSAECEWGSMIPGVTYLPVASTTVAPAGALTVAPTPAILPLCTQTVPFWIVPCDAVITVAFLMTRSVGVVEVCAVAAATESTKTPAIADTGASRGTEGLIRDDLQKKEAKRNATIVACSYAETKSSNRLLNARHLCCPTQILSDGH